MKRSVMSPANLLAIVRRVVMFLYGSGLCSHEYRIDDIRMTGIEPIKEPQNGGYYELVRYFQDSYTHDSHTKRVTCDCCKCGETAYAHCGLMLNGRLVR